MSLQPSPHPSEAILPLPLVAPMRVEAEIEAGIEAGIAAEAIAPVCPEPLEPLEPSRAERAERPNLKIFLSTFLTIFLAELGDKTQLTTLLLAAKSHAPWVVFAGAGTALVATSLIGVWLGCWLAQRISPKTLETAAGVLLLLISAQLVWEVCHL